MFKAIPVDLVVMIHDNQIRDFGGTSVSFPDGNKRFAFNSCEIFLGLNGYELDTSQGDFAEFVEDIASSTVRGSDIDDYIIEIAEYLEQYSISYENK